MGLNSEWSDFYNEEVYEFSDDDEKFTDVTYEEWCDINSTHLLNDWFTLQENAQLYYKLNQKITFADFCEFMYSEPSCGEETTHLSRYEFEETTLQSRSAVWNLWVTIGSPKTFVDFYKFYC
jgi:hypothetical protein